MATHVAYRAVLIAVLALAITGGVISEYRASTVLSKKIARNRTHFWEVSFARIAAGIIFLAYAGLYFVNAWAPEVSPDGSGYHLELVARYLRAHGFEPVTTNMYAGLSEGVEMLFVPAFAIGKHSSAALVHFWFAGTLALLIFAYGVRLGKEKVGAVAALLVFLCPVVGIDGSSAYVDVASTAVAFAVFYWLEDLGSTARSALLIPIGLLGGYCYAAKYTAAVMLLYAIVFIAWRARSWKPLLVVTSCAAVMIVPWMVKDWVYLHDPIAPFGSSIFRNPNIFPILEEEWVRSMRATSSTARCRSSPRAPSAGFGRAGARARSRVSSRTPGAGTCSGPGAGRRAPFARGQRPDPSRLRKHEQRLGPVRPRGDPEVGNAGSGRRFLARSFGAGFSAHSCRLGI